MKYANLFDFRSGKRQWYVIQLWAMKTDIALFLSSVSLNTAPAPWVSLPSQISKICIYETLCAIWYHLCNLKSVKNIHGGAILLKNKQHSPMGVFHVFKIVWIVSNCAKHHKFDIGQTMHTENTSDSNWDGVHFDFVSSKEIIMVKQKS